MFVCVVWCPLSLGAPRRRADDRRIDLLYANRHDLWLVSVLYVDVNWHVLPLPDVCFIFSQRHAALHYANADCERLRWLRSEAFLSLSVILPHNRLELDL